MPNGDWGIITNLQDFAVHDGPGLRVLVFLKGCPLGCVWCQNPENMLRQTDLEFHPSLCVGCMHCLESCTEGAIRFDTDQRVDRSKCSKCMRCVESCKGKALKIVGELVSVDELVKRLVRYKPFFDGPEGGGVTLSGGEPLSQPGFAMDLLDSLRKAGIHTAIETCGYTDYKVLRQVSEKADLVIYDIKHMDEVRHKAGTGVSNKLILDNLSKLAGETNIEIAIHIPLICGFNDDDENIALTARFVKSLKRIKHVDLLPFNDLASGKYGSLGLEWEYTGAKPQSKERLVALEELVKSCGIEEVVTGGLW